jgi:hypothetical protein
VSQSVAEVGVRAVDRPDQRASRGSLLGLTSTCSRMSQCARSQSTACSCWRRRVGREIWRLRRSSWLSTGWGHLTRELVITSHRVVPGGLVLVVVASLPSLTSRLPHYRVPYEVVRDLPSAPAGTFQQRGRFSSEIPPCRLRMRFAVELGT